MNQKEIKKLAKKHSISQEAVLVLCDALQQGNLTMAQFNHPELGGSGQWMQGGMVMIGDMFNQGLKAKVNNLCTELATALANQPADNSQSTSYQSQWQSSDQGVESKKQSTSKTQTKPSKTTGPTTSFRPMTSTTWWPAELGTPNSSGEQNNLRYAYFGPAKRLVIEIDGQTTVYDTGDHHITGVSQQQSNTQSLTFTSQHGQVPVSDLKVVSVKE